jgi:hypothetical protein
MHRNPSQERQLRSASARATTGWPSTVSSSCRQLSLFALSTYTIGSALPTYTSRCTLRALRRAQSVRLFTRFELVSRSLFSLYHSRIIPVSMLPTLYLVAHISLSLATATRPSQPLSDAA